MKKHKYLILTCIIILLIMAWFVLLDNGNYGTTLFFTIPSSITFLIGYSTTFNGKKFSKLKKGLKGFLAIMLGVALFSGLLIAIGLEGAICVLMAYPFFILPMTFSYIIGLFIGTADRNINKNVLFLILILNPTTYIFDSQLSAIKENIVTEKVVNTTIENIWKDLSTEIKFNYQPNILFQEGISYPKSIKLNKDQKDYLCITNNDTINLELIKLKINSEIKFRPREQTIPMKELTPYDSIDAKHLHNYFFVNYGRIQLKRIDDNKTNVIATTSYNYKIAPKWYWKLWSNHIIEQMHLFVINSLDNRNDR